MYGQLILDQSAEIIQWEKQSFPQIVLGQIYCYGPKNKVGPLFHTIYKINLNGSKLSNYKTYGRKQRY